MDRPHPFSICVLSKLGWKSAPHRVVGEMEGRMHEESLQRPLLLDTHQKMMDVVNKHPNARWPPPLLPLRSRSIPGRKTLLWEHCMSLPSILPFPALSPPSETPALSRPSAVLQGPLLPRPLGFLHPTMGGASPHRHSPFWAAACWAGGGWGRVGFCPRHKVTSTVGCGTRVAGRGLQSGVRAPGICPVACAGRLAPLVCYICRGPTSSEPSYGVKLVGAPSNPASAFILGFCKNVFWF